MFCLVQRIICFHTTSDISFLGEYNDNTNVDPQKRSAKFGFQVRPFDAIGFSALKEQDLQQQENLSTIFQLDIMPDNDCWIFNFNYKDVGEDKTFSFKFVFNFGQDDFKAYKTNFFSFDRLKQ